MNRMFGRLMSSAAAVTAIKQDIMTAVANRIFMWEHFRCECRGNRRSAVSGKKMCGGKINFKVFMFVPPFFCSDSKCSISDPIEFNVS